MQRNELEAYLNELLAVSTIQDYCPNGLQVEGSDEIKSVVAGVTACQALLDRAVTDKADLVLVHHGYFWRGEAAPVVGIKRQRLATLLQHNINLMGYHLPLDVHPEFGNNVQLAKRLGLVNCQRLIREGVEGLLLVGDLPQAVSVAAFSDHLNAVLARQPLVISASENEQDGATIKRVALCTGAAQGFIETIDTTLADAYVTGEASEQTVHYAREAGIHFFAAGHHATERYGIQALAEHLQQRFELQVQFVDIDNPV